MTCLAVILVAGLAMLYLAQRSDRPHISDESMARSDVNYANPWVQHSPEPSNGIRRRYRAFVSAEHAINGMKSSANSSQTTLQDSHERSSSNPWDRRHSWLTSSKPSILEGADVVLYDAEHEGEPWQKVRRASIQKASRQDSSLTLSSPPSTLHSPPRKLPVAQEEEDDQPQMSKLKRWMSPGTVKIFEHPPPDLHQGDSEAAVAMIGAGLAATTGGRAMARCPVEVPFDSSRGLPDSWMHTSPQDESSMPTVSVH